MNKHDWSLFYLLSAFVFGCCLFLIGFYPVDFQKSGLNPSPLPPTKLNGLSLSRPKKQHSNVVFMVVDALRFDFVDTELMPYTSRHCKIKLKATIPTVTLPRIKSLTSGTISNFIDVILNLGSSQPLQDSILHKLHERGDKVVFYGDFTWVDLFSKIFHRYESNTDSFYLSEYHEGDNNITKSLHKELLNLTSWDFLILHYIGLDRIGHMEGSSGGKMFLKLREMDGIVELIDKALTKKVTGLKPLLLLTADHGMRIGGGHGGSSPEEIYVPLISTGRYCSQLDKTLNYNQVDIAPTLSILLDVPIPSTSIGCIIPELMESLTPEEKLYAFYYNTKFLIDKAIAKFGKKNVEQMDYYSWYQIASDAHTVYLTNILKENTTSAYLFEKAKLNYIRSANEVSDIFAKSYTRFDFGIILFGIILTGLSTVIVFVTCLTSTNLSTTIHEPMIYFGRIFLAAVSINTIGYVFHYVHTSNIILMCLTTVPLFVIILLSLELSKLIFSSRLLFTLDIPISIAFGIFFQIFSLCSTSFIEEEHQTWYYLGSTFLLSLFWRNISNTRLKVITFSSSSSLERDILIFFRILSPLTKPFLAVLLTVFVRRLNQTGDKWMRVPDMGDWFVDSDNKIYLSFFLVLSLLLILYQLKQYNNTPLQMVACIITCMSVYCYRGVIDAVVFFHAKHFNPFLVLPFYWLSLLYILASSYLPVIFGSTIENKLDNSRLCKLLGTNLTIFTLLSALLHKPHNVFLIFAIQFVLKSTFGLCDNLRGPRRRLDAQMILLYKVVVTIYVCRMFYFYQGNSNSLATIDLNPGYIGLSHYNPLFVGIMVTANTYFAEIFGFLYLLLEIFKKQDRISISRDTIEFTNDDSEQNNYNLVTTIMATIKLLTTSVYLILMVGFRHHLFIFTVFSPKVLYECFAILLFYFNISMTNLYFYWLHKII